MCVCVTGDCSGEAKSLLRAMSPQEEALPGSQSATELVLVSVRYDKTIHEDTHTHARRHTEKHTQACAHMGNGCARESMCVPGCVCMCDCLLAQGFQHTRPAAGRGQGVGRVAGAQPLPDTHSSAGRGDGLRQPQVVGTV